MSGNMPSRIVVWVLAGVLLFQGCAGIAADTDWPPPSAPHRPWARWWWMGSAVDEANLTALLTHYRDAGLGGVEICPIYGVKGAEEQYVDFLSPRWMDMLEHTMREGHRLGMGVDLTTGTGWPFGGPQVTEETASMKALLERYAVAEGQAFSERIPKDRRAKLAYLAAVSEDGRRMELTERVKDGRLDWEAPAGRWTVYEVSVRCPVQRVKRAAPGGAGYVVDPYSVSALDTYLAAFEAPLSGFEGPRPRAHFHDSFEYFEATWTGDFFDQFERLRGYDLRDRIEALFGDGPADTAARVKSDYRETISDLHLAYIERWTQWCHGQGSLSRNQAHGSPGNLIDLYGAADIPETEIFREVDERQLPMLKFSSSAAHLKGTALASSESFTWLHEHFQTSLDEIKAATDFLFLGGVNHIFFHGIPYSPKEADWPGWQFYASVNFGPDGGLWRDLPAYNEYVTRCQSILQSGRPDQDVLLYLPVYDFWHSEDDFFMPFRIHNQEQWLYKTAYYDAAMTLWRKGFSYDAISDRYLAEARVENGKVIAGGNAYSAIVVPRCRIMPAATLRKLLTLARQDGATVLFLQALPEDVPGLADLDKRRKDFAGILAQLPSPEPGLLQIQQWSVWTGRILLGELEEALRLAGINREPAVDAGVHYVRRTHPEGFSYFFVNRGDQPVSRWISLGRPARSAVLMDPRFSHRTAAAAVRQAGGVSQLFMQLEPGQSMIVRTFTDKVVGGQKRHYTESAGQGTALEGTWDVTFVEGGPQLPRPYQTESLASWTEREDPELKRFAGTARYTLEFERPSGRADEWVLDLGQVCDSARVRLNGVEIAVLWSRPYRCRLGDALRPGMNQLEIEVTNLAANRIRDLDRRGVEWKMFYDINIVNINYKPLDASEWPLRDSGLLGPVVLWPQKTIVP